MHNLLSSLRIEVLKAKRASLTPQWNFEGSDPFARIYFILDGKGHVVHHNRTFALLPGHFYLIPPQTYGVYRCPQKMDKYYIHFRAHVSAGVDLFSLLAPDYEIIPSNSNYIGLLFEQLICDWKIANAKSVVSMDGIVRFFLSKFLPEKIESEDMERIQTVGRFSDVLSYIESNLSRAITLAELADLLKLNSTYFSNLFNQVMGISPLQYINRLRIEKAQGLLLGNKRSLKSISAEVGFNDLYYFLRLFKKKVGVTPSKYRAQRLQAL